MAPDDGFRRRDDVGGVATVVTFGFGVLLLTAFVARSRRAASPILDLSLFENRVFATANTATFFIGASFMAITIFLPLFLVNVLGVTATRAGAALIPFSMGVVFSATMAGQMVNRTGYRWPIFGIILILWIVGLMVNQLLVSGAGLVFAVSDAYYFQAVVLANYVSTAVLYALTAVVSAVSYHDLRVVKEGVDVSQIAAVFD